MKQLDLDDDKFTGHSFLRRDEGMLHLGQTSAAWNMATDIKNGDEDPGKANVMQRAQEAFETPEKPEVPEAPNVPEAPGHVERFRRRLGRESARFETIRLVGGGR